MLDALVVQGHPHSREILFDHAHTEVEPAAGRPFTRTILMQKGHQTQPFFIFLRPLSP